MLRPLLIALALSLVLPAATTLADSLYGNCVYKDGSKADGTVTVSTSWNSKKGFPKGGKYELDFGGSVGKKITIYVNGSRYKSVTVKGRTRLDIVVP